MTHNSRRTPLRRLRQKGNLTLRWKRGAQDAQVGFALEAQVHVSLSAALVLAEERALLTLHFFVDVVVAAHAVEDAGYGYAHDGGCDVVLVRTVLFWGMKEEKVESDAGEILKLKFGLRRF